MLVRTKFLHCVCMCFDSTGFTVLSEEPSSSWKRLSSISCERDVFSFFPQKHVLWPQASPIDQRLDWVWIGFPWRNPHRLQGWTCSRLMMQYHDVGRNKFWHCVCSIVNMHDAIVFTLQGFPRSVWRTKFFLHTFTNNLVSGTFFPYTTKNTFRLHGFPRSIHRLDWVWIGLAWKIQHEMLLQKTVERAYQLAVVQL